MNRARLEARNYKKDFGVACPPEVLADRMSQFVHYYTMSGALRPFGASCLIAGYDEDLKDHQLYQIDPNGVCFRFFGCAIGKGRQSAKTEIEKNKLFDMTCKEVINWITKILHMLHDEVKDKPFELELSWICEESKWKHVLVPKELREGALKWAKEKIEEDDMEDDDDDDDDDED
jgi:20S proteasome subunit alpha 7